MKLYLNSHEYIEIILDPDFLDKWPDTWGYYEYKGEGDHFATIWLPKGISVADLSGTIAHEAARVAVDYHQTAVATMTGKIVTDFWREYEA